MLLNGTRDQPSALWRAWSSMTIVEIGALCRSFLLAANTTEVHGLESFMKLLESRKDPATRKRGLITGMALVPLPFSRLQLLMVVVRQNSLKPYQRVRTDGILRPSIIFTIAGELMSFG